jgi:hypothetical protein
MSHVLLGEVRLLYDLRSVSQYALISSTLVGLATRYYFQSECCCLKFAVLFLWGALSDERTGLQFEAVYCRRSKLLYDWRSVSQSVCLGVEHPCGTCDQILLPVGMLRSRRSLGILREMFPGHVVSLCGDIGWPPRSPDLTPCDFFLWSYLKAQVYQYRPQTLEGLKEAITQEVAAIPPEMTLRVMECTGRCSISVSTTKAATWVT